MLIIVSICIFVILIISIYLSATVKKEQFYNYPPDNMQSGQDAIKAIKDACDTVGVKLNQIPQILNLANNIKTYYNELTHSSYALLEFLVFVDGFRKDLKTFFKLLNDQINK